MDEKGQELQSEEKGGPKKKRHKTDEKQRYHDDKKAEELNAVWDSAFAYGDQFDGDKWKKMTTFALQGRSRDDMTPMSNPPFDPNDNYWNHEGPHRTIQSPPANPAFFLRFGIIVKRLRNWLDWVSKNCRGTPQCCSLTASEGRSVHKWYPSYWAERDLQASQWVWPPDYGGL